MGPVLTSGKASDDSVPVRAQAMSEGDASAAAPKLLGHHLRRTVSLPLRLDTRVTRFVLVGITGVGVSTAVLWLSTRWLGLPAAGGGFAASVVSTFTNFLMNDAFTWRDRRPPGLRAKAGRLVRYYSTTAAGNGVYLVVLSILVYRLGLYVLAANIVAIGVGGAFNYIVHNLWTWRGSARP